MSEFKQAAIEAGFSMKQIEFLEEFVAKQPHGHDVSEINGLEEMLEDDEDEDDDEG